MKENKEAKTLIIHDLEEHEAVTLIGDLEALVFAAKPPVKHCIGCFGCWLKTPGACIIRDRCQRTPAMLAASDKMIIISKMVYGGYSPETKAVLDRSIGYIMPFFRIVNGEMHHTMRYQNPFALQVHFYGDNITAAEQELARKLVSANAINLGSGSNQVFFHNSIADMEGGIR